jgi:hypothetical protein
LYFANKLLLFLGFVLINIIFVLSLSYEDTYNNDHNNNFYRHFLVMLGMLCIKSVKNKIKAILDNGMAFLLKELMIKEYI